jgi:hypothetical protein
MIKMVKRKTIQYVTKDEFEELKLKHPKAVVSKTKNGHEKMFLGNRVFVVS